MHNFIIPNLDTDSISICYPDFREISKDERSALINEINGILPPKIQMDDDGYYPCVIVFKTKNYILYDGKKIKIKGSSLKASTKCEALKGFITECINIMVFTPDVDEMHKKLQELYMRFVAEIMDVKDIKRWSARKTLSSTMQESERANETRVLDALKGSDYKEGDRFWVYRKTETELCLAENFDGVYDKPSLLKNLYDTVTIFDSVIPVKDLFINYKLKKNYKLLDKPMESKIS